MAGILLRAAAWVSLPGSFFALVDATVGGVQWGVVFYLLIGMFGGYVCGVTEPDR